MKKQQITTCQQDKRVRHGGDIYRNPVRYDFSINLNPLGMPEGVKRRLKETVEDWGRYPDPQCEALTRALADYHQIAADRILCFHLDLRSTSRHLPGQAVRSATAVFTRKPVFFRMCSSFVSRSRRIRTLSFSAIPIIRPGMPFPGSRSCRSQSAVRRPQPG